MLLVVRAGRNGRRVPRLIVLLSGQLVQLVLLAVGLVVYRHRRRRWHERRGVIADVVVVGVGMREAVQRAPVWRGGGGATGLMGRW
jgi:hypothetical protein